MIVVAFLLLAAVGTILRAIATGGQSPDAIPWRTLLVNCVGAFLLGVLAASEWAGTTAVTVGGLGSLTTFSTVVAETTSLVDRGRSKQAAAYALLSVGCGIAAAIAGLEVGG